MITTDIILISPHFFLFWFLQRTKEKSLPFVEEFQNLSHNIMTMSNNNIMSLYLKCIILKEIRKPEKKNPSQTKQLNC